MWISDTDYWLNDGYGHRVHLDNTLFKRSKVERPPGWGGVSWQSRSLYFSRLLRGGWTQLTEGSITEKDSLHSFTKSLGKGWELRKHFQVGLHRQLGRGFEWEEHELYRHQSEVRHLLPNWEWADWDGGRLVWATEGRLETGTLTTQGLTDIRVLKDFNDMKFEAIEAPY